MHWSSNHVQLVLYHISNQAHTYLYAAPISTYSSNSLTHPGEHVAFKEESSMMIDGTAAANTTSRTVGAKDTFTFGINSKKPFTPGGLDSDECMYGMILLVLHFIVI